MSMLYGNRPGRVSTGEFCLPRYFTNNVAKQYVLVKYFGCALAWQAVQKCAFRINRTVVT